MRILHIVSFYEQDISKGGVGRAAVLLARIQSRVGADVTVFTTDSGVEAHRTNPLRENQGGVWVNLFPARLSSRFCFSSSLLRACIRRIREFDIVHIHGLWVFLEHGKV